MSEKNNGNEEERRPRECARYSWPLILFLEQTLTVVGGHPSPHLGLRCSMGAHFKGSGGPRASTFNHTLHLRSRWATTNPGKSSLCWNIHLPFQTHLRCTLWKTLGTLPSLWKQNTARAKRGISGAPLTSWPPACKSWPTSGCFHGGNPPLLVKAVWMFPMGKDSQSLPRADGSMDISETVYRPGEWHSS